VIVSRLTRADLVERLRSRNLLPAVALLLYLGYLSVPDGSAPYATVLLGGFRGVYNSPWMGAITALLSAVILPVVGFFLVRPAARRDVRFGTAPLLVASPTAPLEIVCSKFLSNVAMLVAFAVLLVLAAVAMQFVRGESAAFGLSDYVLPFVCVTLPTCVLTAAAAVSIDAFPATRGLAGGALWIVIYSLLISVSVSLMQAGSTSAFADPLGTAPILSSMSAQLRAAEPAADASGVSVGITEAATHTFTFHRLRWPKDVVPKRTVWFALSVAVVALFGSLTSFSETRVASRAPGRFRAASLLRGLPLPRLVKSELVNAAGAMGSRWVAAVAIVSVAAVSLPLGAVIRFAAPAAWLVLIPVFAYLGDPTSGTRFRDVVRVVATPVWKQLLVRWFAAALLAFVPLAAVGSRLGAQGVVVFACSLSVAALATLLTTSTRSRGPFEVLALFAWYAGPVNGLPWCDPRSLTAVPVACCVSCLALAAFMLAASSLFAAGE